MSWRFFAQCIPQVPPHLALYGAADKVTQLARSVIRNQGVISFLLTP